MAGPLFGDIDGADRGFAFQNPDPLMATKILAKIYASGITAADGIAIYTMPKAGRLVALQYMLRITVNAALTELVQYEVSLQSASQFTQAEAQNVIASFGMAAPAATAGLNVFTTVNLGGFDVPIEAGAKLYVHRTIGVAPGLAALTLNCYFQ